MARTIILSSGDNPNDIKYYPYVAWAWNQLGWDTLLFYLGKHSTLLDIYKPINQHFEDARNKIIPLSQIEGYSQDMVVWASQYFGGGCISTNDILMTAPLKLIPCEDRWHPKESGITAFKARGMWMWAAPAPEWRQLMGISDKMGLDLEMKKYLDGLKRSNPDINTNPQWYATAPKPLFDAAHTFEVGIHDRASAMPKSPVFDKLEIDTIMNIYFDNPPAWVERPSQRA